MYTKICKSLCSISHAILFDPYSRYEGSLVSIQWRMWQKWGGFGSDQKKGWMLPGNANGAQMAGVSLPSSESVLRSATRYTSLLYWSTHVTPLYVLEREPSPSCRYIAGERILCHSQKHVYTSPHNQYNQPSDLASAQKSIQIQQKAFQFWGTLLLLLCWSVMP